MCDYSTLLESKIKGVDKQVEVVIIFITVYDHQTPHLPSTIHFSLHINYGAATIQEWCLRVVYISFSVYAGETTIYSEILVHFSLVRDRLALAETRLLFESSTYSRVASDRLYTV